MRVGFTSPVVAFHAASAASASGNYPDFAHAGPVQPYLVVTDADYKKLPKAERAHFKRCPECGKWFDMRDLDDVFFHCVDGHVPKEEIQFREPPGWSGSTAA